MSVIGGGTKGKKKGSSQSARKSFGPRGQKKKKLGKTPREMKMAATERKDYRPRGTTRTKKK